MKKIILLLPLLFFIPEIAYSKTIRMVAGDFCPYACDPEKENGRIGFTHEILAAIFERHGYSVKVELLPWKRAFYTFNKKQRNVDGIIGG